jgi:anti-sigma factor RsiW
MTDEPVQHESDQRDERDSKDDDAMRALLRRSLGAEDRPAPPAELLRGVQKRIRTRSRGRFFADGWSTTHSRVNYALVATVMLVLIAVAYVALGPLGVSK